MEQLSLFRIHQLQHQDNVIRSFKHPCEGISTCIFAPLPLFCLPSGCHDFSNYPVKIRCLAIDDSGLVIVAPLLMFEGDCEKLLSQLCEYIQKAKQNHLDSNEAFNPLLFKQIEDPAFWNLHKNSPSSIVEQWAEVSENSCDNESDDFYGNLQNKLIEEINYSINFLHPIIKERIALRPNLDLTITSSFMYRAKVYGGNAMAYAEQALRIEPIPILRLIASDSTGKLIETVFSGSRLPKTLSIYLAVEPKIIRFLSVHARLIPDMSVSLHYACLAVLSNIESKYWPTTRRKWVTLIESIQAFHLMPNNQVISDGGPWMEAVAACLKLNTKPSRWQSYILNRFKSYITLEKAAFVIFKKLRELTPKLNTLQNLDVVNSDEKRQSFALRLAKGLLENNPHDFTQLWLSCFPKLEPIHIDEYHFDIVTSIKTCHYYGKLFDNCLQSDAQIMPNVFPNKMLFCISYATEPMALVTVSIYYGHTGFEVTGHQLLGKFNAEVDHVIKNKFLIFKDKLITSTKVISDFYIFSNAMLDLCLSSRHTKS